MLVDRVWVHDTGGRGIGVENVLGPSSLEIRGSLIEQTADGGLILSSSDATVDGSVFRSALPRVSDQGLGRGITAQLGCWETSSGWQCDSTRSSLQVTRSLIEQNHMAGVQVMASDATVDSSVVRATLPRAADQSYGMGLHLQQLCVDTAAGQQCDPVARATASVTRSLIEQNHMAGVSVMASDVTMDSSVVRANLPSLVDRQGGRGVNIQLGCSDTPTGRECDPAARATASVTRTLIEQNHDSGLVVTGADVTVDSTVVRTTLPTASDQSDGRGINIQLACSLNQVGEPQCDPVTGARGSVTRSLIEDNRAHGIAIIGSATTVDSTVVRGTLPDAATDGFGDGITLFSLDSMASTALTNLIVADNARAGVASFGAFTSLAGSRIRCAAFEINGESIGSSDFEFVDGGGNSCGCPTADRTCALVSAGLQPPQPLAPDD